MLKESIFVFLTFVMCFTFGITVQCDQKYQAENGKLCYPCSAGYYKVSDCDVNGYQATCRPCGYGEYLPDCDNSTKCELCVSCLDPRHVKVKNCTTTSNTKCQCKVGFYWKPDTGMSDEGNCIKHSKCKAGEGLVEKGTPYENTKCAPCEEGITYSSKASFNACVACSQCNSTVALKCTTTNDSVCSPPPEKPSTTESSSKDGDKGLVIGIVFAVLAAAVVVGVLVCGCCWYRCRQIRRNTGNNYTELASSEIPNGTTRNKHNIGTELASGEIPNGITQNKPNNDIELNSVEMPNGTTHNKPNNDTELNSVDIPNGKTHDSTTQGQTVESHSSQMSNDVHQSTTHDLDNRLKDDSTGLCNGTSSQYKCTSRVSDKDVQNDIVIKSTDVLKVKHELQDYNTDEDQNTVKDMKENSHNTETSMSELDDGAAISVDAGWVSPREGVQRVSFSTFYSGAGMSDQNDAGLTTGTNEFSERDEADIGSQPDRNYVLSTTQASSHSSRLITKVWQVVNIFMSCNMAWDKFKMFYRRLTSKTNGDLIETVEPDMDNVFFEEHGKSQEAIFKLMIRWRQATPEAEIKHVLQALEDCQQNLLSENLQTEVEKTHVAVNNRVLGQISHNGENVVEAPLPRGELAAFHSASQSVH